MILEGYLTYLSENLYPDLHCAILKYQDYGFDKILYVGPQKSTEYSKTFTFSFNTFIIPLTNMNFKDLLDHEDIIVRKFTLRFGKFSSRKIAGKIKHLPVLDSGTVDYNALITGLEMDNKWRIFNFKGMKTFTKNQQILIKPDDETPVLLHMRLKR